VGFVIAFGSCAVQRGLAVEYQDASAHVLVADQSLRVAFNSSLDAEQGGANVSALLVKLSDAGSILRRAEAALAAGNYSDALSLADTCKSLADGVRTDASVLKSDAVAAAGNWWMTVVFSVAGSVVFVVVLFFVWGRFKQRYLKRLLRSRPEVTG
jgi:hypothetical protein